MQGCVVELIRELMQTQRMSVRKISAEIAREEGGSALGYTQQINRILNDPDYDPTFSTVQKILTALNYSLLQSPSRLSSDDLEQRLVQLDQDVQEVKVTLNQLYHLVQQLTDRLPVGVIEVTAAPARENNTPLPMHAGKWENGTVADSIA